MRKRFSSSPPWFPGPLGVLAGTWGVLVLLVVTGFVVAYRYVGAPPPRVIWMATGMPDGAYYQFGKQYAEILAQDGITLELVSTAGSVENLARLTAGDVSIALVQSGCVSGADRAQLQSLGSLFVEPLWVFTNSTHSIRRLSELAARRVAVGAPGSGTQVLSTQLLAANGVTASNATFIRTDAAETVRSLHSGSIDAAMFVASPDAPVVRQLLGEPGIELLDLERTAAYARQFPFLTPVTLSEGVIDLKRNIPPYDTRLVATAASLVARRDLNVSLIPAVLNAVQRVHRAESVLRTDHEFPSTEIVDLPMNEDAARYIRNGPSFLFRWLPYRSAVLLDRAKVLALPFVALLLPLFKVGPPLYRWRIRSTIYRWYADVRSIDTQLLDAPTADQESIRRRLRELERAVASISVPLAYSGELYHLRLHIRFLQERLAARGARDAVSPDVPSIAAAPDPPLYPVRNRR